jgi:hypothetical protein
MNFVVGDTYTFKYPTGSRVDRKLVFIGNRGDMVFEGEFGTYLTDAKGVCNPEQWGRVIARVVPPLVCYAIVSPSGSIITSYNTLENAQKCVRDFGSNYKVITMEEKVNA